MVELAARHPEIAGIVVINGVFAPIDAALREGAEQLVEQGVERYVRALSKQ